MSCDKWAYLPGICDGYPCPGDCDFCSQADENMAMDEETEQEIEQEIKASLKGFE